LGFATQFDLVVVMLGCYPTLAGAAITALQDVPLLNDDLSVPFTWMARGS